MEITEIEQKILESLISIRTDTAGIKEHLKILNSKVATNIKNIEKNRERIVKNEIVIAKGLGGFGALTIVFNALMYKLFS